MGCTTIPLASSGVSGCAACSAHHGLAVGVGRQGSSVPLGGKLLLEIWAGSMSAVTEVPTAGFDKGGEERLACGTLEHQARNEGLFRRAGCIS